MAAYGTSGWSFHNCMMTMVSKELHYQDRDDGLDWTAIVRTRVSIVMENSLINIGYEVFI